MTLFIRSLTHLYDQTPLFDPVTFEVMPHTSLQLMGPNGSGKSTLLRLIAGLIPPPGRHVFWEGKDVTLNTRAFRESLMYVGHENALLPTWTVLETLAQWARLYGIEAQRIDHALAQMGLTQEAHLPVSLLSAGQRRRLSLCRLLLTDRPLWLLDEPMASLDEYSSHLLHVLVTQFCESGGLVVASSHTSLPWPDSVRHTLKCSIQREAA